LTSMAFIGLPCPMNAAGMVPSGVLPVPASVPASVSALTIVPSLDAARVPPAFIHHACRVPATGSVQHVPSPALTAAGPVPVFETGLPTRYYIDRADIAFEHLVPASTQTACPYKGVTSGYWSVRVDGTVRDGHQDLAWAYDFPTRQLAPIAGLIAFYNEKADIDVDGRRRPGPRTHFFK